MYPDYLSSDDFTTFIDRALALDVTSAVAAVRECAAAVNNEDHEDDFCDPDDFSLIAVFEGRLLDISYLINTNQAMEDHRRLNANVQEHLG